MSAALLLGSVPVCAVDDGVKPIYDEAYYAMTDYYGNLTDGSVVKSYTTNGAASLTDYGDYDEIVNLTNGLAPKTVGGRSVFTFDESSIPDHFYFEGKTAKPFEQLPWTLAVHYTLNGVAMKAEELAGKTGVVEISIDAIPNEQASEYARYNYTLEAMAVFNQDDILSLEAPGAQVQLVGNLRAVLFIGLPGEECHFTIRVGSNDFAFGGMTFLMVPATLSQLSEIAKLSERKDELEDDYEKISTSLDTMLNALDGLSGSLYATAKGVEQLSRAQSTYTGGKGAVREDVTALRGDLSNLADVLDPVESQIAELSKTISESKALLASMAASSSDLRAELVDLENALEALERGSGDVKSVLRAAGSLQSSLRSLQSALGVASSTRIDSGLTGKEGTELNIKMSQVKNLHNAYEVSNPTKAADFTAYMLMASGVASEEANEIAPILLKAMAAPPTLTADELAKLIKFKKDHPDQTEEKARATAGLFKEKLSTPSMTFQEFCEEALIISGESKDMAAKQAKQADNLWTLYAAGEPTGGSSSGSTGGAAGGTAEGGADTAAGSTAALASDVIEVTDSSVQNDGPDSADVSSVGSAPGDSGSSSTAGTSDNEDRDNTGAEPAPAPAPTEDVTPTTPSGTGAGTEADTGADTGIGTGSGTGAETGAGTGRTPAAPEETKPNDAVVDLITDGLDKASSKIVDMQNMLNKTMSDLAQPTGRVVSDLADLCGRLSSLTYVINDAEDTAAAVRGASSELRAILKDAEKLQKLLDDYEPTLQETLQTVNALSANAATTIRSTQKLVADTQDLLIAAGDDLDAGTKQTLEGLSASLRAAAKSLSTTPDMKAAKRSISSIIEDTWHEYTGDINNILLMDANAEAVSLTDARNDAPQSIQVLIRTQEIKKDDGAKAEITIKQAEQTTFWGRVAQMFRDFWASITGIFKGKD